MQNATGPYRGTAAAPRGDPADMAREAITREIGPEERLLWAGRPRQGLHVRAGDALMSLAGLVLGGFGAYFEVSAVQLDWHPITLVVGFLFLALALYLFAGRLALDAWRRGRLYYGVTDLRALILRDGGAPEVRTIDLDRPDDIVLDEESDGSGTIVFGAPTHDPLAGDQRSLHDIQQDMRRGLFGLDPLDPDRPARPAPHVFDRIAGAKAVYDRLREAQRELRQARAASVIRA